MACRHEVDLSGANDLFVAQAVPVQHFATNHPGKGLQANMWMGADLHARRWRLRWACVIEKTPGAYFAQSPLGNGSVNRYAAHICNTCGKAQK